MMQMHAILSGSLGRHRAIHTIQPGRILFSIYWSGWFLLFRACYYSSYFMWCMIYVDRSPMVWCCKDFRVHLGVFCVLRAFNSMISFFRSFTLYLTSSGRHLSQMTRNKEWSTSSPPLSMDIVRRLYLLSPQPQIEFKNPLRPPKIHMTSLETIDGLVKWCDILFGCNAGEMV